MSLSLLLTTTIWAATDLPVSASAFASVGDLQLILDYTVRYRADTGFVELFYGFRPEGTEFQVSLELTMAGSGAQPFRDAFLRQIPTSTSLLIDVYELVMMPGEYQLKFTIRENERSGSIKLPVGVPALEGLGLGRPLLTTRFASPDSAPFALGGVGFVPNPSLAYQTGMDTLGWLAMLFGVDTTAQGISVALLVEDVQGKTIAAPKPTVRLELGENMQLAEQMDISGLPPGEYRLTIEVTEFPSGRKATTSKPFSRVEPREPAQPDDIATFIDYVATPEELKQYSRIDNDEGRAQFLRWFWAKRDPNRATEINEYYELFAERVTAADEAFGTSLRKGRQTIRGKIFILYGPPSEIRTEAIPLNAQSYERWVYNNNDWFLFRDDNETGDFKLAASNVQEVGAERYIEDPLPAFETGSDWLFSPNE